MQNETTTRRLTLEARAREGATWRGHALHPFVTDDAGHSHAYCRKCGRGARVTVKPAPNEIDIGGEAIALDCLR